MSYVSVDQLQKALADGVFGYAQDKKKAAGRALGTMVEIIAFYLLRSWGFRDCIAIERRLPEFANEEITHNVEYSLHPILSHAQHRISPLKLPISAAVVRKMMGIGRPTPTSFDKHTCNSLVTKDRILRNSCTLAETPAGPLLAHLDKLTNSEAELSVSKLDRRPFAIFECKRVGVEEGMRKGPQSIEKAKQGAYVARSVSSLQKLRLRNGKIRGVIEKQDGSLYFGPYATLIEEVVASDDPELLDGFVLTVGVVSNHGNWFTSANHNKELKVLAQSYDWLLFLTDQALSEFIDQLLLNPSKELEPARKAFRASYTGSAGRNRFTKVKMDLDADATLQHYFEKNRSKIRGWFNIISPATEKLSKLQTTLQTLAQKDWRKIRGL